MEDTRPKLEGHERGVGYGKRGAKGVGRSANEAETGVVLWMPDHDDELMAETARLLQPTLHQGRSDAPPLPGGPDRHRRQGESVVNPGAVPDRDTREEDVSGYFRPPNGQKAQLRDEGG